MSIIPDFVNQAYEISRQLEAQAEVTANSWSDRKREEYYQQYIEKFLDSIDLYITGTGYESMSGKGLQDLLQIVSDKIDEFEEVAESSISGDISAPSAFQTKSIHAPIGAMHYQALVPASAGKNEIPNASNETIPDSETPVRMSENRYYNTIDYDLNGPGAYSAENVRRILNRRNES